VNTDELEHQLYRAERRVREIQTKLHRWATDTQRDLWRAGCPANGHVRFGRRPGETHQ
jgi:hypothetical protein